MRTLPVLLYDELFFRNEGKHTKAKKFGNKTVNNLGEQYVKAIDDFIMPQTKRIWTMPLQACH